MTAEVTQARIDLCENSLPPPLFACKAITLNSQNLVIEDAALHRLLPILSCSCKGATFF